ncbi:probable sarcosine oxidase [Carica papaya]|uniref:probable sarcosine oxidase n=1 Tax=Carica papaya TaxID=3649 RepID=UPI000B8CBD28|nr:probable sarcosine oxidase [Carica papaya]
MEYSGEEYDVVVVGAGIMGSCTAYQLAKRGQKTLLLEQFDFLHHRGSSHGESRTIRASYPEDYYPAMVAESAHLWEQAQSEIGYKVYFKAEHLDIGPSDSKSLRAVIASCEKNGIPHQVIDRHEVADKFSGRIDMPEDWIGVTAELGGVIKPTKAVSMFQTLAFQNGAVLRDNIQVTNIVKDEVKGGVIVCGSNGEKSRGKKCVVTAGAWVKKLLKRISGIELPIEVLETTVCYWRIKEGKENDYTINGGFPTFASYGQPYIYGTPSFEYPGLIKVAVHGGCACDPDKRPWGPGVKQSELKKWIERTFRGAIDSSEPVGKQICMYSMTSDGDFVIDFLGGEFGEDVVIGGGFSGHGFKMGPIVGKILAELVLHGDAGMELKHFRIERFKENDKGNPKDFEDQICYGPDEV